MSDDEIKALIGDSKSRLFKILQPAVRKSIAIGDLAGRILEVAEEGLPPQHPAKKAKVSEPQSDPEPRFAVGDFVLTASGKHKNKYDGRVGVVKKIMKS